MKKKEKQVGWVGGIIFVYNKQEGKKNTEQIQRIHKKNVQKIKEKMHWNKFVQTPQGRVLMSILLGLGLAALFQRVCVGPRCRVRAAPSLSMVQDKLSHYQGKCYEYEETVVSCPVGGRGGGGEQSVVVEK